MRNNVSDSDTFNGKDIPDQFIGSVGRAFDVLHAFDGHVSLGLTELARRAGITKSAAQRMTSTLSALGYLARDEGGRWTLTPRTLAIGASYLATNPLIDRANPFLAELSRETGESVNLSIPDGADMVFVARFPSSHRIFVQMALGTRIPMFCTASGRAVLSGRESDEVRDELTRAEREAFTPRTLTDVSAIMARIDEARATGIAAAEEEFYLGDLAIAAPVRGAGDRIVGAVNISGPTSRWTPARLRAELGPQLLHTARAISSHAAKR